MVLPPLRKVYLHATAVRLAALQPGRRSSDMGPLTRPARQPDCQTAQSMTATASTWTVPDWGTHLGVAPISWRAVVLVPQPTSLESLPGRGSEKERAHVRLSPC